MKKTLFLVPFLIILLIGSSGCSLIKKKTLPPSPGGVFKTFDSGETWYQKSLVYQIGNVSQTIDDVNVRKLAFYPKTTKSLYLLPEESGFYITYNAGENWSPQLANLGTINDLAIEPKYRRYIFVVVDDSVYRLEECCDEWTKVYLETRGNILTSVEINPKDSQEVYFTTSQGEIFRSVNSGDSWAVMKRLEVEIQDLIINPNDQNIIYVITSQGLYRTTNKGVDWKKIETLNEYPGANELYHFVFNPGLWDSFFHISKYGILRTDDGGQSWRPINLLTPPGAVRIYAFTFNPKNIDEMMYATSKTLYITRDGGDNWITKSLPTKRLPTFLLTDPEHPNIIYLSTKIPPNK